MKYKVSNKQDNSTKCFICGKENPIGLHAHFYELETNEVACIFTTEENHEGHPGILHGGIISAVLDETMGRVMLIDRQPTPVYTIELTIKYLKTVPSCVKLTALGRITLAEGRLHETTGEIYLPSGEIAATAVGKYLDVRSSKTHESGTYFHESLPTEDDVTEIEI